MLTSPSALGHSLYGLRLLLSLERRILFLKGVSKRKKELSPDPGPQNFQKRKILSRELRDASKLQ